MPMDYANIPEQRLPDKAYAKRLGYHTYDEAILYDGPAETIRIEFKLPTYVPMKWWPVRRMVEAQMRLKGRKLLRIGLWRGPLVEDLSGSKQRSYKLELTEHGSPGFVIAAVAILAGLALLFGAGAMFVMAMRVKPEVFSRLAKAALEWPKALKVIAVSALGITLIGAYKGMKPS